MNHLNGMLSRQWYYTILYCTVLYCTILYCTILYCTILCYTIMVQKESSVPWEVTVSALSENKII